MVKLEDLGFKPVDRAEALVKAANVGLGLAPTASNAAPSSDPALSSDSALAPAATRAIDVLKPVRNGEKSIHFHHNREWEEHHNIKVSHSTKKLSFGA